MTFIQLRWTLFMRSFVERNSPNVCRGRTTYIASADKTYPKIVTRSHNVATSSAVLTALYHFIHSERLCGDLGSPTKIKTPSSSCAVPPCLYPISTKIKTPSSSCAVPPVCTRFQQNFAVHKFSWKSSISSFTEIRQVGGLRWNMRTDRHTDRLRDMDEAKSCFCECRKAPKMFLTNTKDRNKTTHLTIYRVFQEE